VKKQLILMSLASLTLFACERNDRANTNPRTSVDRNTTVRTMPEKNYNGTFRAEPSNNPIVRDQQENSKASTTTSESNLDQKITQRIRQSILADTKFSNYARNIKIVTKNGVVTLTGTVVSDREKLEIEKRVIDVRGVKRVENSIEVMRNYGYSYR